MKRVKISIDYLLLLLFNSSEITVEKIDGTYTKIILEDYENRNSYLLAPDILWELLYAKNYITLVVETIYPVKLANGSIRPRIQQVYHLSEKGREYIKFKYPEKKKP